MSGRGGMRGSNKRTRDDDNDGNVAPRSSYSAPEPGSSERRIPKKPITVETTRRSDRDSHDSSASRRPNIRGDRDRSGSPPNSRGGTRRGEQQPSSQEPLIERELFVGNLISPEITEDGLREFLNQAMRVSKLVPMSSSPVKDCRINNKYGFVEFHRAEDCTKALNMGNIPYMDAFLKFKRPARYEGPVMTGKMTWQELTNGLPTALLASLPGIGGGSGGMGGSGGGPRRGGERGGDSRSDRAEIDLSPYQPSSPSTSTKHHTSQNNNLNDDSSSTSFMVTNLISNGYKPELATKIFRELFIGGTHPDMTGEDLHEFLASALKKMGMASTVDENPILEVKPNKNFAFVVTRTVEDAANLLNFTNIPFLNTRLKIERPARFDGTIAGVGFYTWEELYPLYLSGELKLLTAGSPSRVLVISNMANYEDLIDDGFYLELLEDMRYEVTVKFSHGNSQLRSIIIPRPPTNSRQGALGGDGEDQKEIGKVFIEMPSIEEAKRLLLYLKGKSFAGRIVDMKFYPEDKFRALNYGYEVPHIIMTSSYGPVYKDQVLNSKALAKVWEAEEVTQALKRQQQQQHSMMM